MYYPYIANKWSREYAFWQTHLGNMSLLRFLVDWNGGGSENFNPSKTVENKCITIPQVNFPSYIEIMPNMQIYHCNLLQTKLISNAYITHRWSWKFFIKFLHTGATSLLVSLRSYWDMFTPLTVDVILSQVRTRTELRVTGDHLIYLQYGKPLF